MLLVIPVENDVYNKKTESPIFEISILHVTQS